MTSCNPTHPSTQPETVTETFDWEQREDVQTTVITTVAAVTDQDPTKMEPLSKIIDPDALDSVFVPTRSTPRTTGSVKFQYEGCTVSVSAEGTVRVTPHTT